MPKKVGFMLIGAPKSATTSVANILMMHPEVGFSDIKEPNFFSKTEQPLQNLDKYHSLFPWSENKRIYGEASTTYSFFPVYGSEIAKNIFSYNPEIKIIYIVRNPIDRTYSQYLHWLERGYTQKPFIEATKEHPEILETSKFALQIKQYLEYFPTENILILDFDDFVHRKNEFLESLANFIEIDFSLFENYKNVYENPSWDGAKKHHKYDRIKKYFRWTEKVLPKSILHKIWNKLAENKKVLLSEKPVLNAEDKAYIWKELETDISELENIWNKNLQHWKPLKSD